MPIKSWKIKLNFDTASNKNRIDGKNTFIIVGKGILISLANPYWYVWWLSIGAAFMIKSVKFSFAGVSSFYVGHIIADFIWYLFIGFIISSGRRFFNQKVYIGILIACSLFLLYLGVKFIVDFFGSWPSSLLVSQLIHNFFGYARNKLLYVIVIFPAGAAKIWACIASCVCCCIRFNWFYCICFRHFNSNSNLLIIFTVLIS